MITRKALIIINPGIEGTKGYLPGTKLDLENYYRYLQTDAGGKWVPNEIDHIINGTADQIRRKISDINTYYSFVVYSGHGGHNVFDNKLYLEVKGGSLVYTGLKTIAPKQTVIFDTCRTYFAEETSNFIGESYYSGDVIRKANTDSFKKAISANDLKSVLSYVVNNSRLIFDKHLASCEEGAIQVYSAKKGQASGDDRYNGGYFSTSLIAAGYRWNKNPGQGSVLDIYNATEIAKKLMQEEYFTNQTPEIIGGRRYFWFPFAIRNTF